MAETASISAEPLLAKRVEEMVLNREDPLPPHMSRHDCKAEEDVPFHPSESPIPVIDLGLVSSSEALIAAHELKKLRSALSFWGCFQATGHGIPTSFLDEVRRVSKEFFQLPMEEKKKFAKGVTEFEGYGADPVPEEGQSLDWSDRLALFAYPEHRRNLRFWPQSPQRFREVVEEYIVKMRMLTEKLSRAMARSLDLVEDCFLDQFGEGAMLDARFNYYLPCQRPDLVLGLKAHSDGSGYTVILQDEVGLQVLKDEKWFTVPSIPDSLLILMGDQMEIMSNGVFKSPVHRVLTDSEKERISVAVFYTPEPNKEIGPEAGLVNGENQMIFKTVKNYADMHWQYYQRGQRALHVAKA